MTRLFFLTSLIILNLALQSQEISKDYFRSPLDIPLYLSGNFGELRSNHFHAGLDIKTQGVEGQKVYAVADGYVSRIKVSPYGYGNAIYITHPNGFTSVYGHLQKYNDAITKMVKQYQYKKEKFAVQLFPTPFQLQVKKGDIIAYSGNSGGSGGPHLHFEIRNTATEHPHNPLFFGFDVKDNVKPQIRAITIYPLNDSSEVMGGNLAKRYTTTYSNGKYRLNTKQNIQVYGEIGFGIETVDKMTGTSNTYGLHNIQLKHNGTDIFEQQIDEFAFHEGRYINAHIDYKTYRKKRRRVQKSFVQEGNKLRIYKTLKNKGHINFDDDATHQLSYRVKDLNENEAILDFEVQVRQLNSSNKDSKALSNITFFPHNQRNTFVRDNLLVDLPKGVLYEDTYFTFEETAQLSNSLSPVYWLHNHFTPLHSYITVSIKVDGISAEEKAKAVIVSTVDGKAIYPEGGEWKGNNITVKTRSFGGYMVTTDTIPPKIAPITISNGSKMSSKKSITLKISDNLSGIGTFRGTVDGEWVLMAYDAKNDRLSYYFDEKVSEGEHTFQLIVTDKVGNSSKYKASFLR